jgi:hypothetical protein
MKAFDEFYDQACPVTTAADTPLWYYDLKAERALFWKAALEWLLKQGNECHWMNELSDVIRKELEQ